jgi:CheY-like chemotaxis protein
MGNDIKQYHDLGQYDVIVIDLVLPGIDGIELIRMLASEGGRAALIVISGYDKSYLETARVKRIQLLKHALFWGTNLTCELSQRGLRINRRGIYW